MWSNVWLASMWNWNTVNWTNWTECERWSIVWNSFWSIADIYDKMTVREMFCATELQQISQWDQCGFRKSNIYDVTGNNLSLLINAVCIKAGCTLSLYDKFCTMLALKQGHRCNHSSESVTLQFQSYVNHVNNAYVALSISHAFAHAEDQSVINLSCLYVKALLIQGVHVKSIGLLHLCLCCHPSTFY